jgi:threonine dehydrogenase-like Zn-dependent dehydrogenase
LHLYDGLFPQFGRIIPGHEFVGIVQDVGKEISHLKRGDRVVVPYNIACGRCFQCQRGQPTACQVSNPKYSGTKGGTFKDKGAAIFGYTDYFGGVSGGQAEAVRVPFADYGARKIPDHLSDEEVLFLSEILPAGWAAVEWAGVRGGETVVVFGCGPTGLMAMKAAWLHGAERVVGVDVVSYRLKMAQRICQAEAIDASQTDPVDAVIEMTDGRGADLVIDAVGMEAARGMLERVSNLMHLQMGTIKVIHDVFSCVRRGGFVSVLGTYGCEYAAFPLGQWFDKGITVRAGQVPVHNYIDELMKLVAKGKIRTEDIITHPLRLSDVGHAYRIFSAKEDECVKVVLHP